MTAWIYLVMMEREADINACLKFYAEVGNAMDASQVQAIATRIQPSLEMTGSYDSPTTYVPDVTRWETHFKIYPTTQRSRDLRRRVIGP